jgi:phosphatidylglycerophosphate synthase
MTSNPNRHGANHTDVEPQTESANAGDRRPIASRSTAWAQKITAGLAKTAVQPNHISIGSMVFAALAGVLFFIGGQGGDKLLPLCWILAGLAVQGRLLCNLFDGMLAVEAGRGTSDGLAWNEFPDRYADVMILIGVGYGVDSPSLGWMAACFAILTAYTRELGNSVGAGADFVGPMAKQHRMAVITIAAVLSSLIALLPILSRPELPATIMIVALWLIVGGAILTSLRRTTRLLSRLRGNRST